MRTDHDVATGLHSSTHHPFRSTEKIASSGTARVHSSFDGLGPAHVAVFSKSESQDQGLMQSVIVAQTE